MDVRERDRRRPLVDDPGAGLGYPTEMALHELLSGLVGRWVGSSSLWLGPTDDPRVCASTAEAVTVSRGKLVRLDYTWSFEDEGQEGSLILSRDEAGDCRAAWTDSWHMGDVLMPCRGNKRDELDFFGEYGVGEGEPPWGWRTRVEADGDALRLRMWNVTPGGEESRAVEANYDRDA